MGHPGVLVDFLLAGSCGQPSSAVMSLAFPAVLLHVHSRVIYIILFVCEQPFVL